MNKIILLLSAAVLLIGGFAWYKTTPQPTKQVQQQTKIFESKLMKFKISIPQELTVEEKFGQVTISSLGGKIFINRNGTNFDNLKDYLKDLGIKNKTSSWVLNYSTINNLDGASRLIGNDKNFYIYAKNWVYLFSTGSEPLYPLLDQIVQTFQYIP